MQVEVSAMQIFRSMVLCKFVNGVRVYACRKCEALRCECIRLSKRVFRSINTHILVQNEAPHRFGHNWFLSINAKQSNSTTVRTFARHLLSFIWAWRLAMLLTWIQTRPRLKWKERNIERRWNETNAIKFESQATENHKKYPNN